MYKNKSTFLLAFLAAVFGLYNVTIVLLDLIDETSIVLSSHPLAARLHAFLFYRTSLLYVHWLHCCQVWLMIITCKQKGTHTPSNMEQFNRGEDQLR